MFGFQCTSLRLFVFGVMVNLCDATDMLVAGLIVLLFTLKFQVGQYTLLLPHHSEKHVAHLAVLTTEVFVEVC